ncbi:hypothetical protein ARTHRO9V_160021 [Arthrobacter sp. 9V]|nr:hypothetical protein ARTHRO9V_160021 [Arthrobacter sp. 9V]
MPQGRSSLLTWVAERELSLDLTKRPLSALADHAHSVSGSASGPFERGHNAGRRAT